MVEDYIPKFCPELKKNKKTKPYIEGKPRDLPRYENVFVRKLNIPEDVRISFSMKESKNLKHVIQSDMIRDQLNQELDMIDAFYKKKVKHPTSLTKKEQRKRILAERYIKEEKLPFKKRYEQYLERVLMKEWVEDEIDPDAIIHYKQIEIGAEEADELETFEALRELGINISTKSLGKKARKVVRKDKEQEKKSKKKGKKEKKLLRDKYMESFADGRYETFDDFERSVMGLMDVE